MSKSKKTNQEPPKSVEMVGPAGRVVVPTNEVENYKARGYAVLEAGK